MTPNSLSPNSVVHQFILSNSKFCSIERNSETANSALNLIDGQQNLSARTQNCKSNYFKSCTLLITTPTPTPPLLRPALKWMAFPVGKKTELMDSMYVSSSIVFLFFVLNRFKIEDRGTQRQFSENICSEDDLRSRIFWNISFKISCLPAPPRIFEHLKNGKIAHF